MAVFQNDFDLPEYISISVGDEVPDVLKNEAQDFIFPLNEEDLRDIMILEAKYDSEENCAGLAAPQIGIGKKAIIFSTPDNPEFKKWCPDYIQSMPRTLWLNPSYEPLPEFGTHFDYEGCFSVKNVAGLVERFKKINYKAFSINGDKIEGEAEGYLARVIQHEVDHVNGILYVEKANPDKIFPIEEYRKMRLEAMSNQQDE